MKTAVEEEESINPVKNSLNSYNIGAQTWKGQKEGSTGLVDTRHVKERTYKHCLWDLS